MRLAILLVVAGCGRIGFGIANGDGNGTGEDGANSAGTISGIGCQSQPFTSLAAAYVVGNVETAGTSELLLLEQAVPCAQLCSTSWDDSIPTCETQMGFGPVPNGMQFVRLILGGSTAGTYAVVSSMPNAAQAVAIAYVTIIPGASPECFGNGGSVTITSGGAMSAMDGTLSFTYSGDTLSGSFHATWCAAGWYP